MPERLVGRAHAGEAVPYRAAEAEDRRRQLDAFLQAGCQNGLSGGHTHFLATGSHTLPPNRQIFGKSTHRPPSRNLPGGQTGRRRHVLDADRGAVLIVGGEEIAHAPGAEQGDEQRMIDEPARRQADRIAEIRNGKLGLGGDHAVDGAGIEAQIGERFLHHPVARHQRGQRPVDLRAVLGFGLPVGRSFRVRCRIRNSPGSSVTTGCEQVKLPMPPTQFQGGGAKPSRVAPG